MNCWVWFLCVCCKVLKLKSDASIYVRVTCLVLSCPFQEDFVCVNLNVSGSWYKLKQILMILRPEKKEIIKIKTGLCYREVLLHKDRF